MFIVYFYIKRIAMENLATSGEWSRNLIDVSEEIDLEYWCSTFKVTPEQLKTAVKAVCNCAADRVKAYLDITIH